MNVALPKRKMTVSEFLVWWETTGGDERFELVDGNVVARGRDRVSHNRAKMRAVNLLILAIRSAGVDCEAFVDGIGVSPNRNNYRIPDAVVNCGKTDQDALILDNPVILVEVVSPASEERDVHAKLHDYFAIGSVAQGEVDLVPPGIRVSLDGFFGEA